VRFAVLGNPDGWYFRDLSRAAGARHEVIAATFSGLASSLGQGFGAASGALDLRSIDAVLVRTMPPGSLEQVVFRMDVLARLEAAGVPVINPPRALEAAVDKYLALAKLEAAGLRVPRTVVCQEADAALAAFETLGRDVVLKPLFGAEGRGITRLTDPELALRAFRMLEQLQAVIYLQEFIPHEGCDLRIMILGEQALGMRRMNPADWRTNVSRGAQTEPLEVTADLAALARRAAEAVGAPLAGVDLLPGRDGQLYAIEVNAVPGWRALARTLSVDVAHLVLEFAAGEAARTERHGGEARA